MVHFFTNIENQGFNPHPNNRHPRPNPSGKSGWNDPNAQWNKQNQNQGWNNNQNQGWNNNQNQNQGWSNNWAYFTNDRFYVKFVPIKQKNLIV